MYTTSPDNPCKSGGAVDFDAVLARLVQLAPRDYYAHEVLARGYLARERPDAALGAYRAMARAFPERAEARHAIEELLRAHPELDPIADPMPDELHRTAATRDAALVKARIGFGLGAALRRARGAAPVVAVRGRYVISGGIAFAGALEWTGASATDGMSAPAASSLGASAGLARQVATTGQLALSVETAADVEWRTGAMGGAGAGGEVGLEIAARHLPAAITARVERWGLAGPDETRVVVGLSFELR
jgi:hypothetical protein